MKYEYRGYTIKDSQRSGGKAGKGRNKTTSLIVTGPAAEGSVVPFFKYITYPVGGLGKRAAIDKARLLIDNLVANNQFDKAAKAIKQFADAVTSIAGNLKTLQ